MSVLVIVICLGLAYMINFTFLLNDRVYGNRATILTVMLIGYSIFRAVRLYLAIKKEKEDEATDNF